MNSFTFKKINKHGCITGVSTRYFGSMKSDGIIVKSNSNKLLKKFGLDSDNSIFMNQVHGDSVKYLRNDLKEIVKATDGILTKNDKFILCVTTADCAPLVFFSPSKKIIGVAHAGYKGILKGIVEKMILKFTTLDVRLSDIFVGIGPCIGDCCYNVSIERIKLFDNRFKFKNKYSKRKGQYYLNLRKIIISVLVSNGIQRKNIEVLPYCTKCNMQYFYSYRGDSKETFGEFVTFAKLT